MSSFMNRLRSGPSARARQEVAFPAGIGALVPDVSRWPQIATEGSNLRPESPDVEGLLGSNRADTAQREGIAIRRTMAADLQFLVTTHGSLRFAVCPRWVRSKAGHES